MHFSRLDWESGYSKAGEDIVAPQENAYVTATKKGDVHDTIKCRGNGAGVAFWCKYVAFVYKMEV